MKDSGIYIGDSAGAMVQADYYYVYHREENRVSFHEGLFPESKQIFIVHADNPWHTPAHLKQKVQSFAEKHNLKIISLNENQEISLV